MQDPVARRFTRLALMAGAAAALVGCASIPHLGPAPKPKPVSAYAGARSFAAPAAAWPSDRWWTAYGDQQLNGLIEEALAGAPDLAKARARLRQAEAFRETAASTLGPHLAAVASVSEIKQSYNNGVPKAAVPHGWNDAGLAGLSLDWQLDFFGKNRALLAAATSEAEAARAEEAQARLTLSTAWPGPTRTSHSSMLTGMPPRTRCGSGPTVNGLSRRAAPKDSKPRPPWNAPAPAAPPRRPSSRPSTRRSA
jgi:hypothetical protein